ncbi:MAG: hypothetical protein AAF616_14100 [Bacteroidota bacterium]
MKSLILLLATVLGMLTVYAQEKVDLPEYGISFEIPVGWSAQSQGDYILVGHQSMPGLIIIFENTASTTAELLASAKEGIYDEGVSLKPAGDFTLTGNKVEGYYEGMLQGAQVKAFAIGLVSRVGSGFSAIVVTATDLFTEKHITEINKLAASVVFSEIPDTYSTEQWKGWLTGRQLRYMYTSGGSDYGGGYSGTSQDRRINLCSNGRFLYYSNSSSSFDGSGGFGYTQGNKDSQGIYKLVSKAGRTYLILEFENGETYEYEVSSNESDHTLLNGDRYFVVDLERCN